MYYRYDRAVEVEKKVANLSSIETVSMMRDVLLPRVERFSKEIALLEESNLNVIDCIRKFDQDISMKASKSEL